MKDLLIFDFEVFKHDTLLGVNIITDSGFERFQTWDLDKIRAFYQVNQDSIWIGHNNSGYDNFILQTIVRGGNEEMVKMTSDKIIGGQRRLYLDIPLNYYDMMSDGFVGVKTIECALGKNISESKVDFNLDRKLTKEERDLTESYNADDLDQTMEEFLLRKGEFLLRLDVINEFNLPISALHVTGTQLAEMVLHAEKIEGIETWVVKPKLYDTLRLKNKDVIDFYLNEKFKTSEKLTIELCGVKHQLGAGGIHAAQKFCHEDWAYYFDVSGYYNLIMILYDLLPRSIPEEYRAYYAEMYKHQLELKKTDPSKRWTYKTILLSVFGAMTNPYCKFYDPYRGQLVTITGQLFLVDLLEKLEGKIKLIQSNTDGVFAKPLPGVSEDEMIAIIEEWKTRTGFELKLEKVYNIHQRDVNNYMYQDDKGEIHTLGEAIKHALYWDNVFARQSYQSKEPIFVAVAIVEYFINHKLPEETLAENKSTLRMFQYVCKKNSFDWLEYESIDKATCNITTTRLQNVNRAFALKSDSEIGMIYKRKAVGKTTKAKVSNLADSVFVYNESILDKQTIEMLSAKIDWQYYIDRAYERILEFVEKRKFVKL